MNSQLYLLCLYLDWWSQERVMEWSFLNAVDLYENIVEEADSINHVKMRVRHWNEILLLTIFKQYKCKAHAILHKPNTSLTTRLNTVFTDNDIDALQLRLIITNTYHPFSKNKLFLLRPAKSVAFNRQVRKNKLRTWFPGLSKKWRPIPQHPAFQLHQVASSPGN
jgi:hypothetical protein